MERSLPYLLIVLLLVGGWNESFKSRFNRLINKGEEQPTEAVATDAPAATPTPAVTPRATPRPIVKATPVPTAAPVTAPATQSSGAFFNDPNYHSTLDRTTTKKAH